MPVEITQSGATVTITQSTTTTLYTTSTLPVGGLVSLAALNGEVARAETAEAAVQAAAIASAATDATAKVAAEAAARDAAIAAQASADRSTYVSQAGGAAPRAFQAALAGVVPIAWDSFQRSDRLLLNDFAASGQQYRVTGSETANIQNGVLITVPPTGQSDTNLIDLPAPPTAGAIQWCFTPGASDEQNVVIAVCSNGLGSNSVQIASDNTQWYVFAPAEGDLGPYPFIGQHSYTSDLLIDGKTIYQLSWHYDEATSALTITGPDGIPVTVTNSTIKLFWGNTVCVQARRPATGNTDGSVTITGWAAGGTVPSATPSASPSPGMVPYFPGDNAGYMQTSYHGLRVAWTRDDLDVIACVAPKQWNSGSEQTIISQFKSPHRCFDFRVSATGKIRLELTTDGTTVLNALSDTSIPGVDGQPTWIRATRSAADGSVVFSTSSDPVGTDVSALTWTQLGATQSTSAGDIFTSNEAFIVGASSSSGSAVTNAFLGVIYTAQAFGTVGSSTKLVAGVDFRGAWTGLGLAKTWWWFAGSTMTWIMPIASVLGLAQAQSLLAPLASPAFTGTPMADGHPLVTADQIGTAAAHAATDFDTAGAAATAAQAGPILARDDFRRSDRTITGDISPTGHVWRSTGTDVHQIVSGRLLQNAGPGTPDIDYLDLGEYGEVLFATFVFDASPGSTNAVIGACPTDFGAGGSIQFASFTDRWQIEIHPIPAITPYPVIMSGTYLNPLVPGVTYSMFMRLDRVTGDLTVVPPAPGVVTAGASFDGRTPTIVANADGTLATVSHKDIAPYWGQAFGIQCRRPGAGDGQVRFASANAVRSASLPPMPDLRNFVGDGLCFDGTGNGWCGAYVSPSSWTPSANQEIWMLFAPDSYAGNAGVSQEIFTRWESSNYCLRAHLTTSKKLSFQVSSDGVTTGTADLSTVALSAADGDWTLARIVRVGNDGSGNTTTTFYTGNNPGETLSAICARIDAGTVTWTQLGATVSRATGGETIAAIDGRWRIGTDGTSSPIPFKGKIAFAKHIDNGLGIEITRIDNRAPWQGYLGTPGYYQDSRSHKWTKRGLSGLGLSWAWKAVTTTAPPTLHTQVATSNGTFVVPAGVTALRIVAVGGGGGGGGGGSDALTSPNNSQSGAGAGAAGCVADVTVPVTPGQTLTHTIGGGGTGGVGGAASSGTTGNAGTAGGLGGATTVAGTGVNVTAYPGGGGAAPAGKTSTAAGGGLSGIGSIVASATSYGQVGAGGYATTSARRASPPWPAGPAGGQAGEFATATNGGAGGAAGAAGTQYAAVISAGSSATTSGTAGAGAAANSGCGGGGGGAGAPGGAGANGGAGGSGYVVYSWIA